MGDPNEKRMLDGPIPTITEAEAGLVRRLLAKKDALDLEPVLLDPKQVAR